MKKLFVFVLVVSLLAFAGGAWADDDSTSHGTESDLVSHGTSGTSTTPATAPSAASFLSAAANPGTTMITALSSASADYPSDGYTRVLLSGDSTFSTMSSAASNALSGFVNKLPSGSRAYSIPQINVPDTVASGEVLQVVMPNTMDLKGVQKLYFYPNPASGDTTSDYMLSLIHI